MSTFLGVAVSFAAAFFWGLVYAQVQGLDKTLHPLALLAFTYVCATVVLVPLAMFRLPQMAKKVQASWQQFVGCLAALIIAEALIFYSIQILGGTDASLIEVSIHTPQIGSIN
jgi:drug/metabolite transporter (DMT)-like permease